LEINETTNKKNDVLPIKFGSHHNVLLGFGTVSQLSPKKKQRMNAMNETIRKNEKCFIGLPSCGYGYESAKMCFVACPSDEKYTLKIEIIKTLVESKQYECHVALRKIDPGNFAFCTKICSKIIQSQFCIVLLDLSISEEDNKTECPNPNVHLEYGMMMSQNKYFIPLQDEKYSLPFNISPLDTIKYTESNFKQKVKNSVDTAIKEISKRKVFGQVPPGAEIFTFYNLSGLSISDVRISLFDFLCKLGSHLGFYLFNGETKYKYIGPFDYEEPKKVILHTKLLIDNIILAYKGAFLSNKEEAKKGAFDYLKNNISIDIIVSPFYKKEDILGKIQEISNKECKYPISIYYRLDIKKIVENEYEKIGEIKPTK